VVQLIGWLRKRLLVTAPAEITFPVRGFDTTDAPARPVLETAALLFTIGFEFGIEYPDGEAAHLRLEALQRDYRGFAYEGAIMAMAVRDAISPAPGNRLTEQFLSGPAAPHAFLGCLGIGFALGRMPRPLWRRTLPDRSRIPRYPTAAWAVIDGYGFHQAFFRTRRWLDPGHVPAGLVWDGSRDYAPRAIDQGMGRALWFVAGGNVERLGAMVDAFPAGRRADLWSGAGLAATYAGGVDAAGLEELGRRADGYRASLAVGAVLAVRARVGAGLVTPHTESAARALCGRSTERAGDLADAAMRDLPEGGTVPAYETFRQRISRHFDSH
jgi:hypothetical protein